MGNKRLKGKSAVVTGGGRGIGKEVALALAAEGAEVVLADSGVARDGTEADSLPADEAVREIQRKGGVAIASYESVADFDAAQRIIQACVDTFGRIDILVNCAGILRERMIFNMTPEEWDAVIKVHLYGTWNCCRHACIYMREQGWGRIINATSDAWRGAPGQCNYAAAKAGIVGLTRAIAREMGKYGVTCNAIAPVAATRMIQDEKVKAGWQKRYEAGLLSKEQLDAWLNMAGPEWVAPFVVYLATDGASNINGQVFHVEAGRISMYSEPQEIRSVFRNYEKEGKWSIDELAEIVPPTLLAGYVNPAPPEARNEGRAERA